MSQKLKVPAKEKKYRKNLEDLQYSIWTFLRVPATSKLNKALARSLVDFIYDEDD